MGFLVGFGGGAFFLELAEAMLSRGGKGASKLPFLDDWDDPEFTLAVLLLGGGAGIGVACD